MSFLQTLTASAEEMFPNIIYWTTLWVRLDRASLALCRAIWPASCGHALVAPHKAGRRKNEKRGFVIALLVDQWTAFSFFNGQLSR